MKCSSVSQSHQRAWAPHTPGHVREHSPVTATLVRFPFVSSWRQCSVYMRSSTDCIGVHFFASHPWYPQGLPPIPPRAGACCQVCIDDDRTALLRQERAGPTYCLLVSPSVQNTFSAAGSRQAADKSTVIDAKLGVEARSPCRDYRAANSHCQGRAGDIAASPRPPQNKGAIFKQTTRRLLCHSFDDAWKEISP